jgi:hypothetical protein
MLIGLYGMNTEDRRFMDLAAWSLNHKRMPFALLVS